MTVVNIARYTAWDGVRPLDWYRLMHQTETIRAQTKLSLASVWHHINRRDYDAARAALDHAIEELTAWEQWKREIST